MTADIKLLNKTGGSRLPRVPDEILLNLCHEAAKWIGLEGPEATTIISWTRTKSGGMAFQPSHKVKVAIPFDEAKDETYLSAVKLFQILIHEYAHLISFQKDTYDPSLSYSNTGRSHRRMSHDDRPIEKEAYDLIKFKTGGICQEPNHYWVKYMDPYPDSAEISLIAFATWLLEAERKTSFSDPKPGTMRSIKIEQEKTAKVIQEIVKVYSYKNIPCSYRDILNREEVNSKERLTCLTWLRSSTAYRLRTKEEFLSYKIKRLQGQIVPESLLTLAK